MGRAPFLANPWRYRRVLTPNEFGSLPSTHTGLSAGSRPVSGRTDTAVNTVCVGVAAALADAEAVAVPLGAVVVEAEALGDVDAAGAGGFVAQAARPTTTASTKAMTPGVRKSLASSGYLPLAAILFMRT
jgi:hypothetical protein